ncbi:DNA repair protein XRCC3 [Periplaneta americana]|uniref:DNA repair protein XRCC3 n=1 Tax=Periplaneta americana TaxID=6978 RepID=UPI0037E87657
MADNAFWDLPPKVYENLEKAGLTSASSIITSTDYDLQKLGNLTIEECRLVRSRVSKSVLTPWFTPVADISCTFTDKWRRLSVGCSKLDDFLQGGVALRGITEIAGESSSGKTQLCLQLCLTVQYPFSCGGLAGGAVYICTEDAFPSRRLQELFCTFPPTFQQPHNKINFGDNVFVEHIGDVENLKQCLCVRLPQLLMQRNIRLIVVDSIAGLFRADYEPGDAIIRAKELQMVGSQLHKLADQFRLAVICVNQVADVINDGARQKPVAALGLAWANMVTTRLQLSRTARSVEERCVRTMEVVFAPDLPSDSCNFVVTSAGVCGI